MTEKTLLFSSAIHLIDPSVFFYYDGSKIVAMHIELVISYSSLFKAVIIIDDCPHWLDKRCL